MRLGSIIAGIALTLALVVVVVAVPVAAQTPSHRPSTPTRCRPPEHPVPRPTGASAADDITVTVPRVVIVKLARDGRPVSVATNTGCRPRAGDDVYVYTSAHEVRPASASVVAWLTATH